jgi:predicted O-methyltransferase YrrM
VRWGPRKQLGVVAAIVLLGAIVGTVVWLGTPAAVILVGALQIVTLLAVGYAAATLQRGDRERTRDLRGRIGRTVRAVERSERKLRQRVDDLERHTDDVLAPVRRDLTYARWSYSQLEALLALYHEVRPAIAFPPMRGWMASPDLVLALWHEVLQRRPHRILECGSGVTTLVLAQACARLGHGRVTALEHQPEYAERTRALLRAHGVADRAEVRDAPLEPIDLDGPSDRWYATSVLPPSPIGLVVVDGPPAGRDPWARYPALPLLLDHLTEDAVVYVDDHKRPGERRTVARWLDEHPDWELTRLPHEAGTARLERIPAPPSDAAPWWR